MEELPNLSRVKLQLFTPADGDTFVTEVVAESPAGSRSNVLGVLGDGERVVVCVAGPDKSLIAIDAEEYLRSVEEAIASVKAAVASWNRYSEGDR